MSVDVTNPQHPGNSPRQPQPRNGGRAWIDTDAEDESVQNRFLLLNAIPSWGVSFLLNVALVLAAGLFAVTTEVKKTLSLEARQVVSESLEETSVNLADLELGAEEAFETELSAAPASNLQTEAEPLSIETDILSDSADLLASDSTSFAGEQFAELTDSDLSGEIGGRGESSRNQLLSRFGGNAASEAAVDAALQWIADHQLPDGGWNLDHTIGPTVNGRPRTSPNPGELTNARFGATALALLPFLGNGQTHRNGKYQEVVFNGLKYLMERPSKRGKGVVYSDEDGEMYSHGLVSIVFAECYALTGDERLRDFAAGTLHFIEDCQDPIGGGWRYDFRERGDTSAVGWQIMALKSGKLSGIEVRRRTFKLAQKFLDDVSSDRGAYYGYQLKPVKTQQGEFARTYRARTSVGLLCRMYLGWERERVGLAKGVQWLSDMGPDVWKEGERRGVINMYYNYYATQVLKHYGGEKWKEWNLSMRDFLVGTQSKSGPSKGSWMFNPDGQYQGPGGRLYATSLACLTLEVYYRYLPLYQDDATEDVFITD